MFKEINNKFHYFCRECGKRMIVCEEKSDNEYIFFACPNFVDDYDHPGFKHGNMLHRIFTDSDKKKVDNAIRFLKQFREKLYGDLDEIEDNLLTYSDIGIGRVLDITERIMRKEINKINKIYDICEDIGDEA